MWSKRRFATGWFRTPSEGISEGFAFWFPRDCGGFVNAAGSYFGGHHFHSTIGERPSPLILFPRHCACLGMTDKHGNQVSTKPPLSARSSQSLSEGIEALRAWPRPCHQALDGSMSRRNWLPCLTSRSAFGGLRTEIEQRRKRHRRKLLRKPDPPSRMASPIGSRSRSYPAPLSDDRTILAMFASATVGVTVLRCTLCSSSSIVMKPAPTRDRLRPVDSKHVCSMGSQD